MNIRGQKEVESEEEAGHNSYEINRLSKNSFNISIVSFYMGSRIILLKPALKFMRFK